MSGAADLPAFAQAVATLHRGLLATGEAIAATANLSRARHRCLREIADGPRTVAEIAARLDLSRQGVLRLADQLVLDGFATYEDNPRHRTAKLLTATDPGRRALAEVALRHERWIADTAVELTPLDLPGLTGRLLAVHAALRPPTDDTKVTP